MREIVKQKIVDGQAMPVPDFTRRDVHIPAVKNKAIAIVGMRRTGKTTLLWQILSDRVSKGANRNGIMYFGFEDERLAGMTVSDLDLIVSEFYLLHPEYRDRRRATFLFDEIQVVPGWATFARRLLDSEQVDLFLTGSSARLLSREVATNMRGRAMEALIYPFSFREYLRHTGQESKTNPDRMPKGERSRLESSLASYLKDGGFPEAQGLDPRDRFELLKGYVDLVLLRDVIERHAVSHPVALRWMACQLLANAAGGFSVNKFHNDLKSQGIGVAKDTLHAYLGYLEDAFLFRTVSLSTGSERRRMVNPRKAYPIDPALIPVFERTGRANLGHTLETVILLELDRRGLETGYVLTPNGLEVDFLARNHDGKQELIQVCVDMGDPVVLKRETTALQEAGKLYPHAARTIITMAPEKISPIPHGIIVRSAADWLLK